MHYFKRAAVAITLIAAALTGTLVASTSSAQGSSGDSTIKEIEKYRQALGDGNPADLWEARGEDIWKQKRGPNKVSLELCDIGLGPGKIKGAYAVLPKYFADTDKVEDLESRLVTCMVMLQGYSYEDAKKNPFGSPERKSDMEALVAYVTTAARGTKMNVPRDTRKRKKLTRLARRYFFIAVGRMILAAQLAMARTTSGYGCRIYQTCPRKSRRNVHTRPGLPTVFHRESCAHSNGDCLTASGNNAFPR